MVRTISWVLLSVLGSVILAFSLLSASVAYRSHDRETIGGVKLADAGLPPRMQQAILARRGTAAAYAAAFATLFLVIAAGPYRRGEAWSWWALLAGLVALTMVTVPRVGQVGFDGGMRNAAILLGIGVVALLLDVGRVLRRS